MLMLLALSDCAAPRDPKRDGQWFLVESFDIATDEAAQQSAQCPLLRLVLAQSSEFLLKDFEGSQAVMLLRKPCMQVVHVSLFESYRRSYWLIHSAKASCHSVFYIAACIVMHPSPSTTMR